MDRKREKISERKSFTTNVEGIESVGAVGAVFEQVFFGLSEFFTGPIYVEAVALLADRLTV